MKVEGQSFPEMVSNHIKYRKDNPQKYETIRNLHEFSGFLLEEVDELWDEIKKKETDWNSVLEECVDIAAFCQKGMEDLGVIEPEANNFEMQRRIDSLGNALHSLCVLIQKNSILGPCKQLGGTATRLWEVDNDKLEELKGLVLNG